MPTIRAVLIALMAHASTPNSPALQAMAGVIAAAVGRHGPDALPLAGLDAHDIAAMMERWFPGAAQAFGWQWSGLSPRTEPRQDEIDDVVALLMDDGIGPLDERRWLAHAIAQATLGANHLWQDLWLPSRHELSMLMAQRFPALAARNDRDMKWKKFLYKQLCDRAELHICRAPSCSACSDQVQCFGPEEAAA
ncbi:nitrogen fixation protein NifQ [Ideonella sp. DXS29W]|uniref:Nitrogen fixation protein NifQ n=1 Tax=Ideonella lacteola TaxID=2984193 RepID=A0ABU9BVC6_9BURK